MQSAESPYSTRVGGRYPVAALRLRPVEGGVGHPEHRLAELSRAAPHEAIEVRGRSPELRVHLVAWCRSRGHPVELPAEPGPVAGVVRPGSVAAARWQGAERSGPELAVRAKPSWGLAARGATVEAGGPQFDFPLDERAKVWTDAAPAIYRQAAAAQWDPAVAVDGTSRSSSTTTSRPLSSRSCGSRLPSGPGRRGSARGLQHVPPGGRARGRPGPARSPGRSHLRPPRRAGPDRRSESRGLRRPGGAGRRLVGSRRPGCGFARVQALNAEMDDGRRRRLVKLGFPPEEAAALSSLHTRNFM